MRQAYEISYTSSHRERIVVRVPNYEFVTGGRGDRRRG